MSNIPASERKPTRVDFFNRFIDFQALIYEYMSQDFGEDKAYKADGTKNEKYWILERVRNCICADVEEMLLCIVQADTIKIQTLYEYNERRRYMNKAIGCGFDIMQRLQYCIRSLKLKPDKYERVQKEVETLVESLRKWRKGDNTIKAKLQL